MVADSKRHHTSQINEWAAKQHIVAQYMLFAILDAMCWNKAKIPNCMK